jgi:hypothetical protein
VTKSLHAFLDGDEFVIPGMEGVEDDFNEASIKEQHTLSPEQIVSEWKQARVDFIAALSDFPAEKITSDLNYPWGDERGSVARMVEYMIEHDEEHNDEFVKALRSSQTE